MHPDLVPFVRQWVGHLCNNDTLFRLLKDRKTAKMIAADLEEADIPYQDADGSYADFHALRHSFMTGVRESGAPPG